VYEWGVGVCTILWAHGWFSTHPVGGTHPVGRLRLTLLYGFGAGSFVGALLCSRDTTLSTTIFYLSTTLVLISIRLSS